MLNFCSKHKKIGISTWHKGVRQGTQEFWTWGKGSHPHPCIPAHPESQCRETPAFSHVQQHLTYKGEKAKQQLTTNFQNTILLTKIAVSTEQSKIPGLIEFLIFCVENKSLAINIWITPTQINLHKHILLTHHITKELSW